MAGVIPTCLAFVICDSVRSDAAGNVRVQGAFQSVPVRRFPSAFKFEAWVQMTNGNGQVRLTVTVELVGEGLYDDETILVGGHNAYFRDPREVLDWRLQLPAILLEHPAVYRVSLDMPGRTLATRHFVVTKAN